MILFEDRPTEEACYAGPQFHSTSIGHYNNSHFWCLQATTPNRGLPQEKPHFAALDQLFRIRSEIALDRSGQAKRLATGKEADTKCAIKAKNASFQQDWQRPPLTGLP